MQPKIETLAETKLIGQRARMSFADNRTFDLWRRFMPRRREIENSRGTALYSIEVYPEHFFDRFDPAREFEKWAAVEVADFGAVPDEMETFVLPAGLYAVFTHRGTAAAAPHTYRYIFSEWLPNSGYALDARPHFALMGEKYKNDDPNSEEELWIPVRKMNNG